jgi:hypothetical protein
MAAGITYTPIATTTLSSAQSSVTFSSISGSYTDLVLVMSPWLTSGADNSKITVNSDTGTNYSRTNLYGDGSSAGSGRGTSESAFYPDRSAYPNTTAGANTVIVSFMNYSNTTTYKTFLARANNTSYGTSAQVGLWRNTSAITSITITHATSTYASGSTFSLYGITAA